MINTKLILIDGLPGLRKKEIVADFSGGIITSDAGGMLLRQVDCGLVRG